MVEFSQVERVVEFSQGERTVEWLNFEMVL